MSAGREAEVGMPTLPGLNKRRETALSAMNRGRIKEDGQMKKKLAWVLAMCMVLQLSSFTVFAEEGQGGSEPAGVEIVTDLSLIHI